MSPHEKTCSNVWSVQSDQNLGCPYKTCMDPWHSIGKNIYGSCHTKQTHELIFSSTGGRTPKVGFLIIRLIYWSQGCWWVEFLGFLVCTQMKVIHCHSSYSITVHTVSQFQIRRSNGNGFEIIFLHSSRESYIVGTCKITSTRWF